MEKRILIVDDLPEMRMLYGKFLKKAGYDVVTAGDGFESLELMKSQMPDLVVLDIMMPQMSGWDVAKSIRQELGSRVPIIVLTVRGFTEDKIKSINESGANLHLTKPVEGKELVKYVKAFLDKQK